MRAALRVCSPYVSRFTVSPQLISIVFGGWFCFCLFCVVFGLGVFFVVFGCCFCFSRSSRSRQLDQCFGIDDRHSCHGVHGIGSKKEKEFLLI